MNTPLDSVGHFLGHKFTYPIPLILPNHSDWTDCNSVNDIHNDDNYHCGVRSKARICKLVT